MQGEISDVSFCCLSMLGRYVPRVGCPSGTVVSGSRPIRSWLGSSVLFLLTSTSMTREYQATSHQCLHQKLKTLEQVLPIVFVHFENCYLYSAFYDTIVAKQLYRKLSFYNIFIYCRNIIYLTYGNIWLIQYNRWWLASTEVLWGVDIISSQVFVQRKLKHNNVRLIRYNCSTRLWDALYECLAKEMCH